MFEVLSERSYQTWPSWSVVYEWEDVFSQVLPHCEIVDLHQPPFVRAKWMARHLFRKVGWGCRSAFKSITPNDPIRLVWIMDARNYREYTYDNVVPLFLDFPLSMLDEIIKATKNIPFFWVTCFDIYQALIDAGAINAHYFPLSISDQYFRSNNPVEKTIDVIQSGRKNPVLHGWMLSFCERHPDVEYVFQSSDGSLEYVSSKGMHLGTFLSRAEYMNLMARCRVSLVSSPCCDGGKDFGGIDFITPRFFESAVQGCAMIGRYTENDEAKLLGLRHVCPNVQTQDEFNRELVQSLEQPSLREEPVRKFLIDNLTSNRANEIERVVASEIGT